LRFRNVIRPHLAAAATVLAYLAGAAASGETLPLDPKGSSLTFVGEAFLHNFHGEAREFSRLQDGRSVAAGEI
jgi:hypothetical protein